MKHHKFQQIKVRIPAAGVAVRFNAETDKQYKNIRGIFVHLPDDRAIIGSLIGFKVNGQEVFEEAHEVRLLTCGNQVAPNAKYFLLEELLEGGGSSIEGKFTDSGVLPENIYPYDVKIFLWLINPMETT
jgi:hypothetical protein